MILAGWECCDKWSRGQDGRRALGAADEKVAAASMSSEARLLRNHPSVIGFLIGSDNAPPAAISKLYVDALHAEDWPLPIIAAAVDQATAETGPSGMKMAGPYSWVRRRTGMPTNSAAPSDSTPRSARAPRYRAGRPASHALAQELEALWKYPRRGSITPPPPGRYSRRSSLSTPRWRSATAHPRALRTTSPRHSSTTTTTSGRNSRRSCAQRGGQTSTGVIYWMLNNAWPSLALAFV